MAYLKLNGSAHTNPSYTIRSFVPDMLEGTVSVLDWQYHSPAYLNYGVAGDITSRINKVQENWTGISGYTQDELDLLNQSQLNVLTQTTLSGGAQYLSDNIDGEYTPGLYVNALGTATVIVDSKAEHDLTTPPFDQAGTYYLEMVIHDLSANFDLSGSQVSFSSSDTMDPAQTCDIPFDSVDLVNSMSGGGTKLWKVNRDVLENAGVDISDLRRVRFTVRQSSGTADFQAETLRLVPDDFEYYKADVDTNLGILRRYTTPGTAAAAMPVIVQDNFKADNYTYIAKFHTGGTHVVSGNYFELQSYHRVNPAFNDTYLSVGIVAEASNSKIQLRNVVAGATALTEEKFGLLTPNTDYVMIVSLKDDQVSAEVWQEDSGKLTIQEVELNKTTVTVTDPGYFGYQFKPASGGDELDYMYARDLYLAEYVSANFLSNSPVRAVTLYPNSSPPSYLLDALFEEALTIDNLGKGVLEDGYHNVNSTSVEARINDVYVETDDEVFYTNESLKVTKHLYNAYIGGVIYPETIRIHDLSLCSVSGNLRFDQNLNFGSFRVVLWDKYRRYPLWIGNLQGVAPNRWNQFRIPIIVDLYASEFVMEFQHVGSKTPTGSEVNDSSQVGTFWIEDLQIEHEGVTWEASNNDGLTFVKFFDNVGEPYKVISFPSDIYSRMVRNEDLAIYWKMDEKSGTTLTDSSLKNNTGTLAGTAGIVYGLGGTEILKTEVLNTGLVFGAGATASVSGIDGLGSAPVSYTIEFWMRPYGGSTVTDGTIMQNGTGANMTAGTAGTATPGAWVVFSDTDKLRWRAWDAGGTLALDVQTPTAVLSGTAWKHFTLTYDAANTYGRIYKNGVLSNAAEATGAPVCGTADTLIIQRPGASGSIALDEFALYPSALPESSVIRHYNAGISTYNNLRIRARAYTSDSWVSGFEAIPHYAQLGRLIES